MENAQCHVVIVGGGLGGLATAIAIRRTGHRVTVVEQATELTEIGAGIEIPPNATRILKQFGVFDAVKSHAAESEHLNWRSYRDGSIISQLNLVPHMQDTYGSPWLLVHRANYQKVLASEAERLGVNILLGFPVKKLSSPDLSIPSPSAGIELDADIILGCDGLRSTCRDEIQGNTLYKTNDRAYRITVKAGDMRAHAELTSLLESQDFNAWMGPGAHVVSYVLKDTELYNFVFVCKIDLNTIEEMKIFFREWYPRIKQLLCIAKESRKWNLYGTHPMETWIHPTGSLALLGDSCHAMVPYLGQGAAQAVEDAAVLGALFAKLKYKTQLRDILNIYEQLRKPRADKIVWESTTRGDFLHMVDGLAQIERDRRLQHEEPSEGFLDRFADPVFQKWLFDYNASDEVERAWSKRTTQYY